jgi:hypothetical protein
VKALGRDVHLLARRMPREHPRQLIGLRTDLLFESGGHRLPQAAARCWSLSRVSELAKHRDDLAHDATVGHLEGFEGGVLGDEHDPIALVAQPLDRRFVLGGPR